MWEIEHHFTYGWGNTSFIENEKGERIPLTFKTKRDALAELAELENDINKAFSQGFTHEAFDKSQYRIVNKSKNYRDNSNE